MTLFDLIIDILMILAGAAAILAGLHGDDSILIIGCAIWAVGMLRLKIDGKDKP